MSYLRDLAVALAAVASLLGLGAVRDLQPSETVELRYSASDLQARLLPVGVGLAGEGQGSSGGGYGYCWNALLELRSCSSEIVLFFINGESHLGLGCCRAIRIITHDCWASMLSTLGFTPQEGNIVKGYCDAETADAPPPAPPSLPPPPSSAAKPTPMADGSELAAVVDQFLV